MSDEIFWGPWVEHDGRDCPCVGEYVHRVYNTYGIDMDDGMRKIEKIGIVTKPHPRSWTWADGFAHVIRYRVRRNPSTDAAVEALKALADNPKCKVKETT